MNADPRKPEKVQRYVPKAGNGTGQEDLTPDYMNILGQHQTTGNMTEAPDKQGESNVILEKNLQVPSALEAVQQVGGEVIANTNTTNVIPTSPQYGVAIIPNPNTTPNDVFSESVTPPTETVTDTTAKLTSEDKELHSTPSKNDRFKVVKIASLEPFKRGRWKCMDYVDEAPPVGATRVPQSSGSIQLAGANYMQTQSLPQQQIQQMLLQSGFTNGAQFFANIQPQMIPQGQYFYPQVANLQNQTIQVPNSIPAQLIGNQPYFSAGVVSNTGAFGIPQSYPNVQYVPANLIQNQNSAFVSTSQPVQLPPNFQQSQSYAGQPTVPQTNVQPVINGHTFTPQNEQVSGSLPTQTVKNVVLNSNNTNNAQPSLSQTQIIQQQNVQQNVQNSQNVMVSQGQVQGQQFQQNSFQQNTQPQNSSMSQVQQPTVFSTTPVTPLQSQTIDQNLANNVYTNPQFAMSVNSLTVLDNSENTTDLTETNSGNATSENVDDPSKTNPVVNAIDNKIEQAMDLVKSHLMYTVREEVEVLKEKIAELMERIQQLETENNFLRSQIPKNQNLPTASNPSPPQSSPSSNFISNSNPLPVNNTSPVSTMINVNQSMLNSNPNPNPNVNPNPNSNAQQTHAVGNGAENVNSQ